MPPVNVIQGTTEVIAAKVATTIATCLSSYASCTVVNVILNFQTLTVQGGGDLKHILFSVYLHTVNQYALVQTTVYT